MDSGRPFSTRHRVEFPWTVFILTLVVTLPALSPTMTLKSTFLERRVSEFSLHSDNLAEESYSSSLTPCSNCVITNITVNSGPAGMAFDNRNGNVYVADQGGGLWVINGSTNTVIASPGAGTDPVDVAYDSTNDSLYVADAGSDSVMVFNGSSNSATVSSIPVAAIPACDVYDPADGDVYVASHWTNAITVINATRNTVVTNISMPSGFQVEEPQCMVYSNTSKMVYVADWGDLTVWALQGTIANSLAINALCWGIAYDGMNGDLYLPESNGNAVTVLNAHYGTTVATIAVAGAPVEATVDNVNGYVYVTDQGSGNVTVVNGATNKVIIPSISVPNLPTGVSYVPTGNEVYVSRAGNSKVAVIAASGASPTLSLVGITPATATLTINGSQTFTATPSCTGGPCPSGVLYSWSLTSGLGMLNSTSGNPVTFTAGTKGGNLSLFVNATLNGISKQAGPIPINITTSVPALASVIVSPPSASILASTTRNFSAIPTCSGGPCPPGTSYAWTLNNSLGSVAPTTGATTNFTAGPTAGSVALTVTATLNGISKQSVAPVTITSTSVLTSVAITPSSPSVTINGTQGFTATPACSGTCPSTIAYTWGTNNTLGSVSPATGSTSTFTAGPSPGSVLLTVKGILNGSTKWANATIAITPAVPALSSVSVSPTSIIIGVGNSSSFTAHPNCTGGACPSGATFSWALNNSALGTISPTTGATETFTAGSAAGSEILFATAYLNGHQATGLAIINITKGIVPMVTGLTLTPSPIVTVQIGKSINFNTTATCNVSPCPSGVLYSWTLNDSRGNLSSASTADITFTAGLSAGSTLVTVTAQLNGGSKTATSDITITNSAVPVITGVTIAPGSATVKVNQGQGFTANATCSPGPCPSSTTYAWALNNSLGSVSPSTGISTQFTAGSSAGEVTLRVNATYNGKTVTNSVVITIQQSGTPPTNHTPPPTFLGLPGYDGYVLLIVVAVVGVAAVVIALTRWKKAETVPPPSAGYQGAPEYPMFPQQPPYTPGR